MASKRDESNSVERDELETQGGLESTGKQPAAPAVKSKVERGEVSGPRIEGLDESEDPTGGAGGP